MKAVARQLCLEIVYEMSGLVQRAANAGKQLASNPHVKGAVEQMTSAANSTSTFVSQRYTDLMKKNSKFVIGSSPSFYVTRENVRMHAFYTTLAECVVLFCVWPTVCHGLTTRLWYHSPFTAMFRKVVDLQYSQDIQDLCSRGSPVAPRTSESPAES